MSATEAGRGNGIAVDGTVTKVSPRTVKETVARFTELAEAKGLRVFAVIDQAAEARHAGLPLRFCSSGSLSFGAVRVRLLPCRLSSHSYSAPLGTDSTRWPRTLLPAGPIRLLRASA